jgi:GTP-binding protein
VNGINKSREIYCLANKTEGIQLSNKVIDSLIDINSLGFGEAIPISSAHGDGMSDLVSIILQSAERRNISSSDSSSLKNSNDIKIENESLTSNSSDKISLSDRVIQLAIMGRPNVGKSTLLNSILGEERVITGPIPGLTRFIIM